MGDLSIHRYDIMHMVDEIVEFLKTPANTYLNKTVINDRDNLKEYLFNAETCPCRSGKVYCEKCSLYEDTGVEYRCNSKAAKLYRTFQWYMIMKEWKKAITTEYGNENINADFYAFIKLIFLVHQKLKTKKTKVKNE